MRRTHPSMVLSCPQLIFPSSDLTKPSLPCDACTHPVIDWRGNQVFSCRVVYLTDALLSALEIINLYSQVVASAHTISPSTFPERSDVEDQQKTIFLNQDQGEKAMLISRGNKDWGVCIAAQQKMSPSDKGIPEWKHYVGIKVFKLFGERRWCSVRRLLHSVWLIEFDSDTMVRVDLKANKIVISPCAQNIPQILALAFSMSILHRLYIPDYSHPSQTADSGFISAPFESLEDRVCRDDFNEDMSCGCNDDLPNSASDNTWGGESLEGVESGCGSTGDAVAGSGGWVGGDT